LAKVRRLVQTRSLCGDQLLSWYVGVLRVSFTYYTAIGQDACSSKRLR